MPLPTIFEDYFPKLGGSPTNSDYEDTRPKILPFERKLLDAAAERATVIDESRLPPVRAKYLEEQFNPVSKEELIRSSKKISKALKRMQHNR